MSRLRLRNPLRRRWLVVARTWNGGFHVVARFWLRESAERCADALGVRTLRTEHASRRKWPDAYRGLPTPLAAAYDAIHERHWEMERGR